MPITGIRILLQESAGPTGGEGSLPASQVTAISFRSRSGSLGFYRGFHFPGSSRTRNMSNEKLPDRIKATLTIELDLRRKINL